jgi:pilus retraction protein PilT
MNFDFADILLKVVEHKASDLHITSGAPPTIRVRGSLVPLEGMPNLTPTDTREIVYAILSSSQRQALETDWQLDFAYSVPGIGRFRVNTFFQRGTLGAAFRLIPSETVPIERLGMPPVVREFATKPRGIVLVTGPTGSGKSTTLASIINEINETRDEHILTIEDPIEFLHRHKRCIVNQREIGQDAPSFSAGLRAALRQDPDVILVGEMRDMETIGTALTAAETGHLVFATLHTQDAPQTIDRIIDVFPPAQQGQIRAQLAIGLQGVVTQTLLPTADGQGRCVAAEVLIPTPGVRNLIREGKTPDLLADPDGRGRGHADDGRVARRPRARGQDHDGHGRGTLLAAGRDAPAGAGPGHDRAPGGRLMSTAVFTYKALDGAGVPSKGELKATSKDEAAAQLTALGLKPMEVSEKKSALNADITLFQRIKAAELTVMTRQLATMITSGMTLLRAFYVLEDQLENKKLKECIGTVREDIESGLAFSDALAKHPKVFSPLYVAMVRAGETGGVLEASLDRIADQLEKDDELRRQVKGAMAYPIVVLTFALCVLIGLIAFIVPVFVKVFEDFGGDLPMITKLTVAASDVVTGQWYVLLAAAIGLPIGFKKWRTSKAGRPAWDRIRLKFPFKIGVTVQKIALARWSRTFAALYSAGVPIMQAIEITGQTAGNSVIEKAMADVIESVKSGGSIADPLKEAPIFPGMVAQMIAVGEETGNLDAMLSKVADFYEAEVAAAVKALTSILEPVMIILVGGIVGFIVIAMYMPMFKVYDAIK